MIQLVDRLEAEEQRGIAVLFEDDRRKQRRLEAMGAAVLHHAPEAAQRRAASRLVVVRQAVQIALNRSWRAESRRRAGAQRL